MISSRDTTPSSPLALLQLIRVQQWPKNLLLLVPIVLAHRVTDVHAMATVGVAIVSYSFCASAIYIVNDLLDMRHDAAHARKRHRPLASGAVSVGSAVVTLAAMAVLAVAVALRLPPAFGILLGGYFVLSALYSAAFKRVAVVDAYLLAAFYAARVVAGGLATGIAVSPLLIGFSFFLFTSLAMLKRFAELTVARQEGEPIPGGRGYRQEDALILGILGGASGFGSAVVLALYISTQTVKVLYHHPDLLWLLCVLVAFWLSRMWILANRGTILDDPLSFSLRDGMSYGIVAAGLATLFAAI